MEATPRVETDCQGILKHAQKELTKGSQRSMKTQTMAPCYRVIRKVGRARRHLRRSHTKAHPEDKGRKPSSFTAKEARIYAADIWADPGKERNAMALSERAMEEGLKHNIVPETVYYVDANEVMEGLFEPGDYYWKQEGGHIRALNTANMMDYVIKEYLVTRADTSVSGFPWDLVQMGFLATVLGRRKHMPCSKKEAQQHIYDKKAHGRNISKGDKAFDPRCPLCSCNDETQAHLLLRCKHPIMEYWRKDYFRCCEEIIENNPDKTPRNYLGEL
jgi:hypothetical protein